MNPQNARQSINTLALVTSLFMGGVLGAYIESKQPHIGALNNSANSNQMEGYYDPVNKVMCYWLKDSKATPACLVVDWPYEVEQGSGDDAYYESLDRMRDQFGDVLPEAKQGAGNASYHY